MSRANFLWVLEWLFSAYFWMLYLYCKMEGDRIGDKIESSWYCLNSRIDDDTSVVSSKWRQPLMVEYIYPTWNQTLESSQELTWQAFAGQMHSTHLTTKNPWYFTLDYDGIKWNCLKFDSFRGIVWNYGYFENKLWFLFLEIHDQIYLLICKEYGEEPHQVKEKKNPEQSFST